MAAGDVDIGTGTSIVFGTSGLTLQILDIKPASFKRGAIDISHMGTPAAGAGVMGNKPFMPTDLVDAGELHLSVHFNPSVVVPMDKVAETITITFPVPAGLTNPATYSFKGFAIAYDPNVPLENKMMADLHFKIDGGVTRVAAS